MDVSQLNRSRVNESRMNCSVLNASGFDGACLRSRVPGIGADIMKSMVLWYDLKKQGATNENMAENPVLRDLSGNGHDATCYNFAWSRMSGIGGYKLVGRGKYTITNVENNGNILGNFTDNNYTITLTVSNIPEQAKILIRADKGTHLEFTEDGTYTIEITDKVCTFAVDNFVGECNIEVIEHPQYPNALVSDGVDDYAMVGSLPILTKDKGYTVIAKRKIFNHETDTKSMPIFCKGDRSSTNESFGVEMYSNNINVARNFLKTTPIELQENDISFQTSVSYNGQVIKKGNSEDGKSLYICTNENQNGYKSIALYSLLLFNRDLTTEEIEWVKTNLIESEQ